MKYIVIMLALAGCGNMYSEVGRLGYVNSQIEPYVQMYLAEKMKQRGNSRVSHIIQVEFGELPSNQLGVCRTYGDSPERFIIINPVYWGNLDEANKRQLIYHEMGHCDLGLDHYEGGLIMNPRQIPSFTFVQTYDILVTHLFGGI